MEEEEEGLGSGVFGGEGLGNEIGGGGGLGREVAGAVRPWEWDCFRQKWSLENGSLKKSCGAWRVRSLGRDWGLGVWVLRKREGRTMEIRRMEMEGNGTHIIIIGELKPRWITAYSWEE